jgi:hypothetical protein
MNAINCPKGYGLCWGCTYPCDDPRQFAEHLAKLRTAPLPTKIVHESNPGACDDIPHQE